MAHQSAECPRPTGWYLYDELLRTPLIFSGNTITSNKLIKNQVGSVDIFPTILDLIGLSQINNDILIAFGFQDNCSYLVKINKINLENLLNNELNKE